MHIGPVSLSLLFPSLSSCQSCMFSLVDLSTTGEWQKWCNLSNRLQIYLSYYWLSSSGLHWGSSGHFSSETKWVFCITRRFYFSTSPLTPFAKLIESWPFSNWLQEIDLCVHAMLGKAWMKHKSGDEMGMIWPCGPAPALREMSRFQPAGTQAVVPQGCSPTESNHPSENPLFICNMLWWLNNLKVPFKFMSSMFILL